MSSSTNYITTHDALDEVLAHFMKQEAFAFDIETTGINRGVPTYAPCSWLSLATEGRACAIPMGHPNGSVLLSRATRRLNKETKKFAMIPAVWDAPPPQLKASQVWETLTPLFMSDKVKIAHNATFDLVGTAKYFGGKAVPGPHSDTIVLQWLLNENMRAKDLKTLVKKYFGVDYDKEHVGRCVEIWGFNKVARYAYLDAKFTYLLWKMFSTGIVEDDLEQVTDLEEALIPVLCDMNLEGALLDIPKLEALKIEMSASLVEAEAGVYKAAGQRFNINSNPQKVHILFGDKSVGCQGLTPKEFTKNKVPSTSGSALEHFPKNKLVQALANYQDVHKLLTTYVIGYLGDPDDIKKKPCRIHNGRVHTDLVQYGTVTGRFSSRIPNLQNIPNPSGSEMGRKIRSLFIAPPDHSLIVADYGQIELVVLAHFSKAKALVDGFNAGVDAHTLTASKVYGVPFEEVTKPMRSTSKGINFAVVYGSGADKVASMGGIPLKKAKGFLKIHQREFPEIYEFKDAVIETAKTRRPPYIRTLLGRKRRLPELFRSNKDERAGAERQAVNSLIQGSAADIIKYAMIRLHDSLPPDMKMILSIHDELVMTCPDDRTEEGSRLMREAMLGEGIQSLLSVPMTIDLSVVKNWADAK